MEGCLGKTIKYLLFATNFLVFVLGCAVLGVGIWVLVDANTFMDLFGQINDILGEDLSISIYSSATYILIAVAVIVILVSFFGCCGAVKESKCLLGTYFAIVLAVFIMCIVGAVLGYSGNLEETIKAPFKQAIAHYDDQSTDPVKKGFRDAVNQAQEDFKCCGVDNVRDWNEAVKANWTTFPDGKGTANKPEGCCKIDRQGTALSKEDIITCRTLAITEDSGKSEKYYFNGCYTEFELKIKDNQNMAVGIAIGIVVVMFLNMLFAFAMCTMSGK
jgi:hypothetical protein